MNPRTAALLLVLCLPGGPAIGAVPGESFGPGAPAARGLQRAELRAFVDSASADTVADEFEIDLTGDSRPECFLGVTCGGGGCLYFLFHNLGENRYVPAGRLNIHRNAFEILGGQHRGFRDLLGYWALSSAEGTLTRFEFDGREYKAEGSLQVPAACFDLLRPALAR